MEKVGKYSGKTVQIWVDDLRPVPTGYEGTKSVNETIALIQEIERDGGEVALLDLDHDLGDYAGDGGDAIKILDFLAERDLLPDPDSYGESGGQG